jgi:hypothetical protein
MGVTCERCIDRGHDAGRAMRFERSAEASAAERLAQRFPSPGLP